MVRVQISETYDLSTQVNKMGVIGVHTPTTGQIMQLYPGLMKNFRYYRLTGCDIKLACASMLPADPLQVGTEAGAIAPQDMFNPILYKAVSNESFETILGRMYGGTGLGTLGSVDRTSGSDYQSDEFGLYYSLLAEPNGWKKAMPQQGLDMRGLYPIMYNGLYSYGNPYGAHYGETAAGIVSGFPNVSDSADGTTISSQSSPSMRGNAVKMPRLPTYISAAGEITDASETPLTPNPVPCNAPKTFVGCIIVPPAKLNKFYFRMKVTWTIEFEEVRPLTELMSLSDMASVGTFNYYTDFNFSKMEKKESTVDTIGTDDLEQIMVSSR